MVRESRRSKSSGRRSRRTWTKNKEEEQEKEDEYEKIFNQVDLMTYRSLYRLILSCFNDIGLF